jgi:predicted nucleic acid binding AN1-type Zn finger protein
MRFSYPDYDLRARQEEERHLLHEQAAQRQVIEQKRRFLLSRLRQQERVAKEAAARQCLPGSQGFCSRPRLMQIEQAYAQKREQLERSLAKEQAQREAALVLERELSQIPD